MANFPLPFRDHCEHGSEKRESRGKASGLQFELGSREVNETGGLSPVLVFFLLCEPIRPRRGVPKKLWREEPTVLLHLELL